MGANKNRRVPVETLWGFARCRLGLDVNRLACGDVHTGQVALLPLRVHDVGITRLRRRLVAVATKHDFPVGGANTIHAIGARWAALRVVVLRTAIDVVERFCIIQSQLVVLGDGQVFHVTPGSTEVVALIKATVSAHHDVVLVRRIEHDGVHVAVLVRVCHGRKGLAAVFGFLDRRANQIEAIKGMGAGKQLLVVVRTRSAADGVSALLPARAAIL